MRAIANSLTQINTREELLPAQCSQAIHPFTDKHQQVYAMLQESAGLPTAASLKGSGRLASDMGRVYVCLRIVTSIRVNGRQMHSMVQGSVFMHQETSIQV